MAARMQTTVEIVLSILLIMGYRRNSLHPIARLINHAMPAMAGISQRLDTGASRSAGGNVYPKTTSEGIADPLMISSHNISCSAMMEIVVVARM